MPAGPARCVKLSLDSIAHAGYGSNGMERSATFCGKPIRPRELKVIRELVGAYPNLSRTELANTVCELLDWKRPSGRLKSRECLDLFERLEDQGAIALPGKLPRRPLGSHTRIPVTPEGDPRPEVVCDVGEVAPIVLERVRTGQERLLFRELIGRHHYLGHAVPFGAQLRYLVYASQPERQVVGCLQFSSPAWRMAARDAWIGWSEEARKRNLQRVVNNSRFLIPPWVRVRNLASVILSQAMRRLGAEWEEQYGIRPLLVETLVDARRYSGHCYRAANFRTLGETTGRGRMDREHRREGAAPKVVWVYALVADAARQLREA